jgi:transglutaminase-like putative cysteine protease
LSTPTLAADAALEGERSFRFIYSATVEGLEPGALARVWAPMAPSNDDQTIEVGAIDVPGNYRRETEPKFGNELIYFEANASESGTIPLRVEYLATRRAVPPKGVPAEDAASERYLEGSTLVPVDGSVLKRFYRYQVPKGERRKVVRMLYDTVEEHMRYDKMGDGWGRGDVLWACESGRGNCSDFHSLFIALCRDLSVPAKFEIGFPLPPDEQHGEIAGYHCWAKFLDGDRWVGVDISEADKHPEQKEFFFGNLPPDRIMFSTERDLTLVPKQAAGPVNFLIYPYVEVDGKPYTKQTRRFEFEDVD